jgi:hypothetical protein
MHLSGFVKCFMDNWTMRRSIMLQAKGTKGKGVPKRSKEKRGYI